MHPIGRDPISHSKSPGKFVPDMWKTDNNTVNEFEELKNLPNGKKIITLKKALKLRKQFSLKGDGKLGNTNINMIQSPDNPNFFILQKQNG